MRRSWQASVVAAAIVSVTSAAPAAEMPVKAPVYKAPAYKAPPPRIITPWAGFYIGVSLGGRWASNHWESSDLRPGTGTVSPATMGSAIYNVEPRYGGYAGYNWDIARNWIAGFEVDYGYALNRKSVTPAPGTAGSVGGVPLTGLPTATVREKWDGSVRARLGTVVDWDTLLYSTGGVAFQQVELSSSCAPAGANPFCAAIYDETYKKLMVGWTVGAGMEKMLDRRVLIRLDYRYADFGTFNQTFFAGADAYTAHVKVRTHTLATGFAFKF